MLPTSPACALTISILTLLTLDGVAVQEFRAPEGPESSHISAIHQDSHGIVWVGTRTGLSLFEDGEWGHVTEEELGMGGVTGITPDDEQGFWVTGPGGVTHFDGSTWTPYGSEMGKSIRVSFGASAGPGKQLWVGTDAGAAHFDGKEWTWSTSENGLKHNVVHDVQRDLAGNTWFATRKGGISKLSPEGQWEHHFPEDNARVILLDQAGHLWFGTSGHGVLQFDGQTWTRHHPQSTVLPLFEDTRGNLWFCKDTTGALRYRKQTWTEEEDHLPQGEITCGMESKDRGLWFGSIQGLRRLMKQK